ncbi:RGS2 protein, partial [Scopus umbretta]|nr:RGS2 protein [Scopus umbretta]
EASAMQSALFLALQHDGGRMERGGRRRSEAEEAEKGRMKRTIIKDWKTRLSYFLQNSSNSTKMKSKKVGKHRTYFRQVVRMRLCFNNSKCFAKTLKLEPWSLMFSISFCRPSPEEAQLWSEAFDELLANKYGLAAFRAFLKSEFCEENIEFWLACEDFKKTKSPQKLTSKAKKIYNDFIEKEAPKEINIDFQTKNMIAQNIQEATHTCFSAAQKRVYSLMENNSYPRFLESEFYQELCKTTPITRAAQGT